MRRNSLTNSIVCLLAFAGIAAAQPTDDDLPFKDDPNGGDKIKLFMDSAAMEGSPSGWKRDAIEAEAVKTVSCIDSDRLYDILRRRNMRSFKDMKRSRAMESFTSGYSVDERPWNNSRHRVRKGIGLRGKKVDAASYVWLTIESGRFESRSNGRRRLRMGTDIMDDMYFDTKHVEGGHPAFMLMDNSVTIRGRWRWDSLHDVDEFFELSDKDDSGDLDADELRRITYMDNGSERTANGSHMIRADEKGNNDGKVTEEELEDYPHVLADMRRILIQIKQDGGVDDAGIKRAGKVDIRNDYGSFTDPAEDTITGLFDAIRGGRSSWGSSSGPASPLQLAYNLAKNDPATGLSRLFSTQTYADVLVIEPKSFIRSYRSRYHLNETSKSDLVASYTLGADRLKKLVAMARESRQISGNPEHIEALDTFITQASLVAEGGGVGDVEMVKVSTDAGRSYFGDRTEEAGGMLSLFTGERLVAELDIASVTSNEVVSVDVADSMPNTSSPGRSNSVEDLAARENLIKGRELVAERVAELYEQLADDLDENRWGNVSLRRVITRSIRDRSTLDDHVDWFTVWQKSKSPETLGRLSTADRFVALHDEITAGANLADELAAYNEYGVAQRADGDRDWRDFEPLNERMFKSLDNYLRNEQVRAWKNQIAEAGIAAKGLWFDDARTFYIPSSRRNTGNLLIDTLDFAAMYSADVWDGIPITEWTPATDLNEPQFRDKLIDAALVNEVQIELTLSSQFTDRLNQVNGTVALPYYFMRWANTRLPAAEQNPDGYKKFYDEMVAARTNNDEGNAQLTADIAPFNAFLEAVESPVKNVPARGFRSWIETERFTQELHDDANPNFSPPELAPAIEGANFVYQQYLDMLNYVAELKGDGIIDELEDRGGPDCMEWVRSESSKGMKALGRLREDHPGNNTGVTGALGNSTNGTTPSGN